MNLWFYGIAATCLLIALAPSSVSQQTDVATTGLTVLTAAGAVVSIGYISLCITEFFLGIGMYGTIFWFCPLIHRVQENCPRSIDSIISLSCRIGKFWQGDKIHNLGQGFPDKYFQWSEISLYHMIK